MKRGKRKAEKTNRPQRRRRFPAAVFGSVLVALSAAIAIIYSRRETSSPDEYRPHPTGELTFTEDIAPIVFGHCSECHRQGQPAPFPLLSYDDTRKHAGEIRNVVRSGYMPPWPPEAGHGRFKGERRLTSEQIGMISQWIDEGAPEGKRSDLPPVPQWSSDWHLGPPDLIATMPQPYTVPADGPDIYRNFVVPVPLNSPRYVRAVEFRPGNAKVIHHTLIKLDGSREGRRRDAVDSEIGFSGMIVPDETGHFLGWQPGRLPMQVPEGMPWEIKPGSDLVLQMHFSPGGKPELVQPSLGLYFTDNPPTRTPFRILLTSLKMEIPAGATNYSVEDNYTLPVGVDVLAILPHVHFLGKEIHAWATLPGGAVEPLIYIRNWDFNWQSDYQYAEPLFLPKGTQLSVRFTYDNSTNNIRNPANPPIAVRYGLESTDEMAELWLQVVPKIPRDLAALKQDYEEKAKARFLEGNIFLAHRDPPDAEAAGTVGLILLTKGNLSEAQTYLERAAALNPKNARAFYGLGMLARRNGRLPEARGFFERAVALDPADASSRANLGVVCLGLGDFASAEDHFSRALQLNPSDPLARQGLNEVLKRKATP